MTTPPFCNHLLRNMAIKQEQQIIARQRKESKPTFYRANMLGNHRYCSLKHLNFNCLQLGHSSNIWCDFFLMMVTYPRLYFFNSLSVRGETGQWCLRAPLAETILFWFMFEIYVLCVSSLSSRSSTENN